MIKASLTENSKFAMRIPKFMGKKNTIRDVIGFMVCPIKNLQQVLDRETIRKKYHLANWCECVIYPIAY